MHTLFQVCRSSSAHKETFSIIDNFEKYLKPESCLIKGVILFPFTNWKLL